MTKGGWLFDVGADLYAWFTAQAAWRASCAQLAAQLRLSSRALVVDLGCGPGVSTFELARELPNARLIGLDIAPRMLAQARRRQGTRSIAWLRADATRLPFLDGSVDACTGHSFLYLVSDRAAALAQARRVLRSGGQLVLMEPSARGASVGGVLAVSRDPRHLVSISLWRPFSRLHGRFTPESLAATLEAAGFVDCQVEETLGGLGLLVRAVRP
ncbi:MAG TPA: methyltransferase domain-containing protein [Chloroflexota bacterium]